MTTNPTGLMASGSPLLDCRRVAVVMPTWLGDTIMAGPCVKALRAALSEAHFIGVMKPGFDEIVDGSGWFNEVLTVNNTGIGGVFRCARELHSSRADAVILLPNSLRWGLTAFLSRTRVRVGYARDGRTALLTMPIPCPAKSIVAARDYYADLAQSAANVEVTDRRPSLAVSQEQLRAAERELDCGRRPYAILVPGGNRESKRWPAERFARVAEYLANRHGLAVILSGSRSERDLLSAIASKATCPVVTLSGEGSLGVLKAIVSRARLMVTNDTGPRHLAAALGVPVVTLFGPTDHRWTTLGCPHEAILLAEPFLPESMVADHHADTCRIDRIQVSDVTSAAERLLTATQKALPDTTSGTP